jgi:molybdopterin molybdotransferase
MVMIAVDQAEAQILDLVQAIAEMETISLMTATGRILAQSVTSNVDFPHWDNSAMDGYAVRAADVVTAPVTLTVVEEIPAGVQPQQRLEPGQAARIFTGAMLPEGADTIAIQEEATRDGDRVTLHTAPRPQAFVRHQGEFCQRGDALLTPGTPIGPAEIAVLATAQAAKLTVYRRPKVAIFSTGNELVPPDGILQPGQIVDSNQYALAAFVSQQGAIPLPLGIVPDDPQQLRATIQSAIAQADIVLSTGGVSVGDYDFIDQLLTELGGEIHIQSVAVKPGKPLTVATFPGCLYFGIPGNPVSALVSCWRFIAPALRKCSGQRGPFTPLFATAVTEQELRAGGQRETYLWGKFTWQQGHGTFALAGGSHSSGNLMNLAETTGLAIVPVGVTRIAAGERVRVMVVQS